STQKITLKKEKYGVDARVLLIFDNGMKILDLNTGDKILSVNRMSDEKKSDFDYSWGPTETECCCPVECCCQKMIQMEGDLRAEISNLTLELFFLKLVDMRINETYTCCDKKCINTNLNSGTCKSKNGYVRVRYDGKLKYFLSKDVFR
ncbi:hypothetical protein Mgra_00000591, partial [Meloidogyne graminicola]